MVITPMVKIKQFLVVITSVVSKKKTQFLVVITPVVKIKHFLVVITPVANTKQF